MKGCLLLSCLFLGCLAPWHAAAFLLRPSAPLLLGSPAPQLLSSSCPSRPESARCAVVLTMAKAGKTKLQKALNKRTLTVSVDVQAGDKLLSKRLRRIGIGAIFADEQMLPELAAEQNSAKGDFPGPAPVILRQPDISASAIAAAKEAKGSAIVLPLKGLGRDGAEKLAAEAEDGGLEVLWEVTSQEELAEATAAGAKAFLVSDIEDSFGVAPKVWEDLASLDGVAIAEIKALQPGNSEIELGRTLHAAGCKSVLLSGACPGYDNQHRYVEAAHQALRSKASKQFELGGLIGTASPIGIPAQTVISKEPTIIKEKIDMPQNRVEKLLDS